MPTPEREVNHVPRPVRVLAVLVLILSLPGCATSGIFPSVNLTSVELGDADFRVVATDVGGEASAGYLLGVSAGMGPGMQTVAVARVAGDGQLYAAALRDLWRSFEAEHGPVRDRRLALVNVRFDSEALNLLVYTRPRVWVRADVVEFEP